MVLWRYTITNNENSNNSNNISKKLLMQELFQPLKLVNVTDLNLLVLSDMLRCWGLKSPKLALYSHKLILYCYDHGGNTQYESKVKSWKYISAICLWVFWVPLTTIMLEVLATCGIVLLMFLTTILNNVLAILDISKY